MPFDLQFTNRFLKQLQKLPKPLKTKADRVIILLAENPRHPSLQSHKVSGGEGSYGGDIFEAYVTMKYRMTWEYGPSKNEITLRNIEITMTNVLKNLKIFLTARKARSGGFSGSGSGSSRSRYRRQR